MRKTIQRLMMVFMLFFLFSCDPTLTPDIPDDDDPITEEPIGNVPVFIGLDDRVYYVGDTFDPKEGITITDPEDGDITHEMHVLGLDDLPLEGDQITGTGTYELVYIVIDSDKNWVNQVINVTFLDVVTIDHCSYERDNYVLTWCDDFTGQGDNLNARGVDLDRWGFQLGTGSDFGLVNWGNNEQQYYRSENAVVDQGKLIIEAKLETYGGMTYTSSRLYTKETFSQKYGRFEAMIKLPVGEGLWPAFWLMPRDSVYGTWANSGEIDIMEARGRLPWEVSSALHFGGQWPDNRYTSKTYTFTDGKTIADEHLYAVEWDETEMRFYVNDVLYHTITEWSSTGHDYPAPFDQPFYIIMNLAVGGGFDGNRLPPASLFDEPVQMEISFVRVYQRA